MSDTDEFRYTTLGEGEGQLAGIMDDSPYPGDEPAHWDVYFAVSDADAAIARIEELGGRVVRPAEDTPYGRLATVVDPTGTQFRIVATTATGRIGRAVRPSAGRRGRWSTVRLEREL